MYICMYINLDMPSMFTQNIYNHISINILHIYMATKRICITNTQTNANITYNKTFAYNTHISMYSIKYLIEEIVLGKPYICNHP